MNIIEQMSLLGIALDDRLGKGGEAEIWSGRKMEAGSLKRAYRIQKFTSGSKENWVDFCKAQSSRWSEFATATYVVKLYDDFCSDQVSEGILNSPLYIQEMEKISGDSLHLLLEQSLTTDDKSSIYDVVGRGDEFIRFILAMGSSFTKGHAKGLYHGDAKLDNFCWHSDGGVTVPKLIDFGMVNGGDGSISTSSKTIFAGSPEYTPLEVLLGQQSRNQATDVFGFGVCLRELLTGQFYSPTTFKIEEKQSRIDEVVRHHQEVGLLKVEDVNPQLNLTDSSTVQLVALTNSLNDAGRSQNIKLDTLTICRELKFILGAESSSDTIFINNSIVQKDTYKWNQSVHKLLSEELFFYVISVKNPFSFILKFKERMEKNRVGGYSILRLIGENHYLIRIWIDTSYERHINRISEIIKNCEPSATYEIYKTETLSLHYESKDEDSKCLTLSDLNQALILCAEEGDDSDDGEYEALKALGCVGGKLKEDRENSIRIFVIVKFSIAKFKHKQDFHFIRDTIEILEKAIEGIKDTISSYVVDVNYSNETLQADKGIMFRLIIPDFWSYSIVLECFEKVISEEYKEDSIDINYKSYIDLDKIPYQESDDGTLIDKISFLRN